MAERAVNLLAGDSLIIPCYDTKEKQQRTSWIRGAKRQVGGYRRATSLYFSLLLGGERFARDSLLRQTVCRFLFSPVPKLKMIEFSGKLALSRADLAGENRPKSQV
jgi:hypothetical protein